MCHIRFRKAWKVQGHSVEELPFTAMGGVWGSWLGFSLVCLVLIAQFYIVRCSLPFSANLADPIFVSLGYLAHRRTS